MSNKTFPQITKQWQAAPGVQAMFRQASIDDLPDIMKVEQSWNEEGRAEEAKFITRLKKFPQGFLIAYDELMQKPIATITSCPVHYHQDHLANYASWNVATNQGYFREDLTADMPLQDGENALYIVSGVIDNDYRGADIFSHCVGGVVDCAKAMGLDYVLAGAVIPGYKRYCEKSGVIPAADYVAMRRGSSLIDPLLAMYEKIGFHVPDSRHVIPEYFPDDASLNYAALVVYRINRNG